MTTPAPEHPRPRRPAERERAGLGDDDELEGAPADELDDVEHRRDPGQHPAEQAAQQHHRRRAGGRAGHRGEPDHRAADRRADDRGHDRGGDRQRRALPPAPGRRAPRRSRAGSPRGWPRRRPGRGSRGSSAPGRRGWGRPRRGPGSRRCRRERAPRRTTTCSSAASLRRHDPDQVRTVGTAAAWCRGLVPSQPGGPDSRERRSAPAPTVGRWAHEREGPPAVIVEITVDGPSWVVRWCYPVTAAGSRRSGPR